MGDLLQRFDEIDFDPSRAVVDANGFLRCDGAPLTRTGVFEYKNPDGSVRREYRPAEEVFHADSLASFRMMPITLEHPPARADGLRLLDSVTAPKYQVGFVGDSVRRDGDVVRGPIAVTDARAVAAVKAGKRGLSNGYTCLYEATPGITPSGERYDGIQRTIRGNHSSLVSQPRAGSVAMLRLDGQQEIEEEEEAEEIERKKKQRRDSMDTPVLGTVVLDSISYKAAPEIVNLITKMRDDLRTMNGTNRTLQAKLDALAGERDGLKVKLDAAEKRVGTEAIHKAAIERVGLLAAAKAAGVPETVKLDGLTNAEIKREVVKVAAPEIKLDGKDAGYVGAVFDAITTTTGATKSTLGEQRRVATSRTDAADPKGGEVRVDAAESRKKMIAESQGAWKPKGASA